MDMLSQILIFSLVVLGVWTLMPGIRYRNLLVGFLIAVGFSLVNTLVLFLLGTFAGIVVVLTMGIAVFLTQAVLLLLTANVFDDYEVDDFPTAFFASLLISLGDWGTRSLM